MERSTFKGEDMPPDWQRLLARSRPLRNGLRLRGLTIHELQFITGELGEPRRHAIVGGSLDEIDSLADIIDDRRELAEPRLWRMLERARDVTLGLVQPNDAHGVEDVESH